ncbi:hypothetical protein BD779DRAFT_1547150 [Infundibulicybe gibba]|nr:hypothetical protein BD779DRAFT_1547128 [Infundibulicybe gibba]KAF8881120.1 hypothetical protein BD779DRAFT_1547150 [Infundibulicybe gibba]
MDRYHQPPPCDTSLLLNLLQCLLNRHATSLVLLSACTPLARALTLALYAHISSSSGRRTLQVPSRFQLPFQQPTHPGSRHVVRMRGTINPQRPYLTT